MAIKSSNLAWVTVNDFDKALKFYKDVLGFKEHSVSREYQWAELVGEEGGSVIGLAVKDPKGPFHPGENAIITLTVENIESEMARLKGKAVELVGDLQEVPGHVKMQLIKDLDGNYLQLVELL